MGEPTYYIEDLSVTAREADTPNASFKNGMNLAGSCSPGIGINMNEGAVVGEDQQFTLLDQRGAARVPQTSQHIGGNGLGAGVPGILPEGSIRFGTNPVQSAKDADPALDGTIISIANSTLVTLDAGWVAAI